LAGVLKVWKMSRFANPCSLSDRRSRSMPNLTLPRKPTWGSVAPPGLAGPIAVFSRGGAALRLLCPGLLSTAPSGSELLTRHRRVFNGFNGLLAHGHSGQVLPHLARIARWGPVLHPTEQKSLVGGPALHPAEQKSLVGGPAPGWTQICCWSWLALLADADPQRLHFAVEMAALEAEQFGGVAYVVAGFLNFLEDVLTLVGVARLLQS
jgi:hypothetical protein